MSAYPAYPYDTSYPPPPQAYYGQPYTPHPPNSHPSHSPTAQPPARPHTTAPFPTTSQFAPPPAAGYYAAAVPPPPQPNGHGPPTPSGPPSLPAAYPPQPAGAPNPYDDMSPEQLQSMIDRLHDMKMNKSSPKPAEATRSAAPPRIDTSIGPPPPPSQAPPQSARGPVPPHGHSYYHYPYPYPPPRPAPSSHNGEMSPPPSALPPAKGYPPHHSSKSSAGMPGSFCPEAPAPPAAPKTPAPGSNRPESTRKASEQASEVSYSSSTKSHIDMSQAWEQWGGNLVEISPGREPRPKPKLVALFRGIAGYMIALLEPTQSCVVTLDKLIQFYKMFSVAEDLDWRKFFHARSPKVLSDLFCALNVEHHLVSPSNANQPPSIPGLTPRGFDVWMFTQLMAAPSREHQRITKILDRWTIFEQGVEMPRLIPRECFPQGKDMAIYQGWWQAVREDFPEDSADSDDERKLPLGLPEPEKRRRGYSRSGDLSPEAGPDEETSKESPTSAPSQAGRRKTGRHYTVPISHEFLASDEKESPSVERYRQTYASSTNPSWKDEVRREEVNPRPILGEEPVQRPPTRAQSTRAPKPPKEAQTSTRKNVKRGRSVHRKRDESPESEDDYDDPKYDGYGKRYEADGLYDDPSPPSQTTTPYHPSSSHHEPPHHRHSRGLSRPPPAAGKSEKDIKEYTYQDQYEKEKDYSQPAGGAGRRQHRGSDAYGNRKNGKWRYDHQDK